MNFLKPLVTTALFLAPMSGCDMNEDVVFEFAHTRVTSAKAIEPGSFHVRGHIEDGKFIPEGKVLGEGTLEAKGQVGWLELTSGKFYPMHTMQSPISPYVDGVMTDNGFVPSSREIR